MTTAHQTTATAAAASPVKEKEDTLDYYLSICDQFKLGELPTECPNPTTADLSSHLSAPEVSPSSSSASSVESFLAQYHTTPSILQAPERTATEADDRQRENEMESSVGKALALLQQVDKDAFATILGDGGKMSEVEELSRVVHRVLTSGHSVILEGCGATGRLSLSVEAFAHQGLVEPQYASKIKSFMAGGDVALIRSIEKFEDRAAFGARQLRDIGFVDGDLLMAITEGGETPFVIAACEEAVKMSTSVKPYFIYCNPDDVLCRVADRSARVISDPRITKLNASIGPMAITGSTRMQATSIQLAIVGLAIQHHNDPSQIKPKLTAFVDHITTRVSYSAVAAFTLTEAKLYAAKEKFLYETRDFCMTVMTDTTERSPTFSLPPYENYAPSGFDSRRVFEPMSSAYLCIPGTSNQAEAWRSLLGREPRPLEWEETRTKTGRDVLVGYNFSEQVAQLRARQYCKEILHKKEGEEKEADLGGVCQYRAVVSKHSGVSAGAGMGGLPGILFQIKQHQHAEQKTDVVITSAQVAASEEIVNDILLVNLLAKVVMNAHSTSIMGLLRRFEGNVMTFVKPSNYKLIDRAARYVALLLKRKREKQSADSEKKNEEEVKEKPFPSYEQVVTRIFEMREHLGPEDPIVVKVVNSFL